LNGASGHTCSKGLVAESFEATIIFKEMKCGNCGKLLFAKDKICPNCGAHALERQTSLTPAFLLGAVALVLFIYLLAVKF